MKTKICYKNGAYWINDNGNSLTVFKDGLTHAISDSSYARDLDGLSIAKARCDYLAKYSKRNDLGYCAECFQDTCQHELIDASEGNHCLDCGKDMTEWLTMAAYDRVKDNG